MKHLETFAKNNNLTVVKITYKGQKRKGFDLIDKDRRIFASFEPRNYQDGSGFKWFLRNGRNPYGVLHFKRITNDILSNLDWVDYPDKLK